MKTVSQSIVISHELVLPNDINVLGNILGGRVMHLMDMSAAMSAYRHARKAVVTASVDQLDFLAPAKKGDILILKSSVNYIGNTSMEVGVRVDTEHATTGDQKHTASAYLTFVSLDKNSSPIKLDKIKAETKDEIRRYNEAKARYLYRKKIRKI